MSLTAAACILLASFQPQAGEARFLSMSADERREWIIDQAAEYEIRTDGIPKQLRREEPVLRFNDNVTRVVDAMLFVWTLDGRPEVAASFWYRKDGLQSHEFVSLSRSKVELKRNDEVVWAPDEAGVLFKLIPNAPVPADSKVLRLAQMRRIADRFAASIKKRSGDLRLRLLPQPMVRYEAKEASIIDGALFSFAKGTNPEVLLVIEAEIDERGELRFVYSPARMTSVACRLFLDQDEVWSVPSARGLVPSGTYRNLNTR